MGPTDMSIPPAPLPGKLRGGNKFGDFAWLFTTGIIAQKISEAHLLWRGAQMSAGPILEIGRMAGGTTALLLGASGDRPMVSIDFAPFHNPLTDEFFGYEEIARRLKLYVQSSRQPIPETEFGYMFIDGDHSYEGVCADIANFWNALKPFDGRPGYCAFHDAAAPAHVESVKKAVDELLAEPGACRVVESASSLLLVEKTGDIDAAKWRRKIGDDLWTQISDPRLDDVPDQGAWTGTEPPAGMIAGEEDFVRTSELTDERLTQGRWRMAGISLTKSGADLWGMDNRIYQLNESDDGSAHYIEYLSELNDTQVLAGAFLRPGGENPVRLSIVGQDDALLASVDFRFLGDREITTSHVGAGATVLGSWMRYETGFFACNIMIRTDTPHPFGLRIQMLHPDGRSEYDVAGNPNTLHLNSATIRSVKT